MSNGDSSLALLTVALPTRRATVRLGRVLGSGLERGDLVLFSGELGVGKTFLVRAICRALGVSPDIRVASPSFSLVHEHEGRLPILHVDLYRLGAPEQVRALGLREARADAVLLVEWGTPFSDELGGAALHIELSYAAAGRLARVSVVGGGSRWKMLGQQLGRAGLLCG